MAEEISVTGEQARTFLKRSKELERQFEGRPEEILEGMQLLIGGGDWLGEILTRERQCHKTFFGQRFALDEFRKALQKYGQKKIQEWQKLALEPQFLPEVSMSQDDKFRGWKVKPEDSYYRMVAKGDVLRRQPSGKLLEDKKAFKLEGITVLIDIRLKPPYDDGKQMWKDDNLLGPIIKGLREKGKIAKYKYGPQNSRFGVSADEWEREIKLVLAENLGLDVSQVRFERAIEMNVIPQIYRGMPRTADDQTNTLVWIEEFSGGRDRRLDGGRSDDGGLTVVRPHWSNAPYDRRSFRPLVVL